MAGPNKQFNQDETLNKALHVFWNKGYAATSMHDLVSAMGINRASLYQTFGNKDALFNSTINLYIENTLASIRQSLALPGSPLGNLEELFKSFVEQSLQGELHGCFINNTVVELGPHDREIAEKLRAVWIEFESIFSEFIVRAIEVNELDKGTDADQLALLVNINLQGILVKTKTNIPKETLFNCIESFFGIIKNQN